MQFMDSSLFLNFHDFFTTRPTFSSCNFCFICLLLLLLCDYLLYDSGDQTQGLKHIKHMFYNVPHSLDHPLNDISHRKKQKGLIWKKKQTVCIGEPLFYDIQSKISVRSFNYPTAKCVSEDVLIFVKPQLTFFLHRDRRRKRKNRQPECALRHLLT